ncbi:60S ribosomal protein [Musa troglodytarum]|uniref:60S ribosomal protein n=1 Tax=Musa troglodytarum TaxID=320322 RepID=A0A9E7IA42_9LILI|nr:60S ribosomal protein [Musa troglodytarum]
MLTRIRSREYIKAFHLKDPGAENVRYEEEFIKNPRGQKIFTCKWLPQNKEPKALIFLCHGYAMECSTSMKDTGTRLAKAGYAVHGMDYEGHGKSSGLQGYIPRFKNLIDDCSEHFVAVCEQEEGEIPVGGIHGRSRGHPPTQEEPLLLKRCCSGGPHIADEMKPHPAMASILGKLSNIIPTWKIVPTKDIIDIAFKSPEKRQEIRSNQYCYKGKPRLKTGVELFMVSLDIEQKLHQIEKFDPHLCPRRGGREVRPPPSPKHWGRRSWTDVLDKLVLDDTRCIVDLRC